MIELADPPAGICEEVLELAKTAERGGEIPIACIIYEYNEFKDPTAEGDLKVIGRAYNSVCGRRDPTAHAEILAIQQACEYQKTERLHGCVMVAMLEPCLMCSGAISLARLEWVFYFTPTHAGLGMEEVMDVSRRHGHVNHYPDMKMLDAYQERTVRILRDFFKARRVRDEGRI